MNRSTHSPGDAPSQARGATRAAPARFWLLVLGGVAALLLQAWLESAEEMAWFGLPLFVLAIGAYRLLGSIPADRAVAQAAPPLGPLRQALAIALVVLLLAGVGVIAWERFTDSGFVGWLDAMQVRHGGRYRAKASFVAAACDILVAYGAAMWAILRIGRRP